MHRSQALLDPTFRRVAIVGRFVGRSARYHRRATPALNAWKFGIEHEMCNHGRRQSGERFEGACTPRVWPLQPEELDGVGRRYLRRCWVCVRAALEWLWYRELS